MIEFISFMVRPFSLGLRPFVAMFAGHILVEVFGSFIVQGINAGGFTGPVVSLLSFVFVVAYCRSSYWFARSRPMCSLC